MKTRMLALALIILAGAAAAPPQPPPLPYDLDFAGHRELSLDWTLIDGDRPIAPPAATRGGPLPQAVIADPLRDPAHPARNRQLVIASQGKGMNALFLLAAGPRPKPTLLLLHGLPGNERNLDLAQAVRRAGWNVLTFTYRGAWGSEGTFSVHHALDDARAVLDFLRSDAARAYDVDPEQIVLAGHSMGGFAAAWTAAYDPLPAGPGPSVAGPGSGTGRPHPLAGVILLDAWDIGRDVDRMLAAGPAGRDAMIAGLDDLGHSLGPITAADLADSLARRGTAWHLAPLAPRLARLPVLTIYASEGIAAENRAFAERLRRLRHSDVTAIELESDHAFADKRIALAAEVVRWLERLR